MTYDTINNTVTMAGGTQDALLAGRYRVVKQLGQGGMGSVWLAEDTQLDNKLFAIKMLPSILVSNKRAYRQLKDEALVAMKLVHPNIVQLRAFEENNGNPFLVMDYIDGKTLDDCLSEWGTLTVDQTARLLRPVAAALDYAHAKGVVHRDVKPGNVIIAKDGTPYILDFGIAREIHETMTRVTGKLSSGTLLYMSPEQLRGQPPKASQDVYSFAAMAYECLKGEPPFARGQIEYQILNEMPPPLPGGDRLSASIMRGLFKEPERRPDSCIGVLFAVSAIRPSTRVRAQAYAPPTRLTPTTVAKPQVLRKSGIAGIVIPIVCILTVLVVLVGVMWYRNAQRQEAARKQAIAARQAEAARQKQEEERRLAQEAARKKAQEEQLAKQKKAEEERKAREAAERRMEEQRRAKDAVSGIRIEAEIQKGKIGRISVEDGFAQKIEATDDLYVMAKALYDNQNWLKAAVAYSNYVDGCKTILSLDDSRKQAVAKRSEVRKSFKTAEAAGAKTYARENWNAAVKTWNAASAEFDRMKFSDAAKVFAKALQEFDSCRNEALVKKRAEKELKEKSIEREKELERQRRYVQYEKVKVGALVQIATKEDGVGVLGIVTANKGGAITISRTKNTTTIYCEYPYEEITNLIIRGDVDENAIMRSRLVGTWTGATTYFAGGASLSMKYEYSFFANGSATLTSVTSWNGGERPDSESGSWFVTDNGKTVGVKISSGTNSGQTYLFHLKKHSDDMLEFQWDIDSLKAKNSHYGASNERHWYDSAGTYHYEADIKSGWSKTRVTNTESPKILRRSR